MERKDENIEDLFESAFDNQFEIQGNTTWEQLQFKRMKTKFFRFRVNELNIYYVTLFLSCIIILFFLPKYQNIDPKIPAKIIIDTIDLKVQEKIDLPIIKKNEIPQKQEKIAPVILKTQSNQNKPAIESNQIEETKINTIEESKPVVTTANPPQKKITKVVVVSSNEPVIIKDTIIKIVPKKVRKRN